MAVTAAAMLADDKGLLAMDESPPTFRKRLVAAGVQETSEARLTFRELLVRTPGIASFISGAILHEETLLQTCIDGTRLVDLLTGVGILVGIKVDVGATPLAFHPRETITEGLDGLRARLGLYLRQGACFAKWRAVITPGPESAGLPSRLGIESNACALARYAALCQEVGLVPVVEPEIIMDGDHDLQRCSDITESVLREVFTQLARHDVALEGVILKPNMIMPGAQCLQRASVSDVAEATLRCFQLVVPAAVAGITFLSGGQSPALASAHLNAMNMKQFGDTLRRSPWKLSFSFARALQTPALDAWGGLDSHRAAAQRALLHRAACNHAAVRGRYLAAMEEQ